MISNNGRNTSNLFTLGVKKERFGIVCELPLPSPPCLLRKAPYIPALLNTREQLPPESIAKPALGFLDFLKQSIPAGINHRIRYGLTGNKPDHVGEGLTEPYNDLLAGNGCVLLLPDYSEIIEWYSQQYNNKTRPGVLRFINNQ